MTKTYFRELGSRPPPTTTQRVFSLTVFYDGNCSICRKEIAFYETREGSDQIEWVNIHKNARKLALAGISMPDALAQLHVITSDGNISVGINAFQKLWQTLPNFRLLASFLNFIRVQWLLWQLYKYFLKNRSGFQKLPGQGGFRAD